MKPLTKLEAGAARAAMSRLLDQSRYFDICAFDQLCKVTGMSPDKETYDALRLVHCVSWKDMDRETRMEVTRAIVSTFNVEPVLANAFTEAYEEPSATKVGLFRRLMGGTA